MRGIAEPIRTLLAFLLKSTQLTIRGFYNVFSRSKIDSLQPPEVPKTKGKLVTILRRHECLKNHCCRHNFCQNMDISFVEFCACGNNSPHPAVVWCCMRFTVCRLLFSDNDIPSGYDQKICHGTVVQLSSASLQVRVFTADTRTQMSE